MSATELGVTYVGRVAGANRRLGYSPFLRRAYPNPDYHGFLAELAKEIRKAMGWCPPWPYPLRPPLSVKLRALLPARMDLDNIIKPVLDALQLAGAVADDVGIVLLEVERIPGTLQRGELPRIEILAGEMKEAK